MLPSTELVQLASRVRARELARSRDVIPPLQAPRGKKKIPDLKPYKSPDDP